MSKGDPETLRNMPEEPLFLVDYTFGSVSLFAAISSESDLSAL